MFRLSTANIINDSRILREAGTLAEEHEVYVLDLSIYSGKRREAYDGFQVESIRLATKRLPKNLFFWVIKYVEYLLKVMARALALRADVYHAYNLDTLLPAWIAAKLRGSSVGYYARELYVETSGMRGIQRYIWRFIEKRLSGRVDTVIAACDERARIMKEEYGAKKLPEVVINCPSFQKEPDSGKLDDFIKSRGVGGKKIALYQGGMMQARCLEELVRSAKYISDDTVIVFMGYGPTRETLVSLTKTEGVDHKVFFHEAVPSRDLLSYTVSADLGIVIYKNTCRNNYYCAPNKLYEYIMAGIPVVGSDFPGISPVVNRYGIGRLFDPEDARSIASAINEVLGDDKGYRRMQKNTERAREVYNWEVQKKTLLKLYDHLLA